jgi:hypothetical protein
MSAWSETAAGSTLGQDGPQGGPVSRDDQNERGFRLILELDESRSFYAVTVSIPDWLMYARFFGSEIQAREALPEMREALDALVPTVPERRTPPGDPRTYEVGAKLATFMSRFP